MPGMRDLSVAVGKRVRRSDACTLMCFVTPLVDWVSEIFQRLSSMAWRWSNTATRMTHESLAVPQGGRRCSPCLEVIQRDEQKVFPFPSPGIVFHVWRTERGSKLKIGLVEVWPESCPWRPMHQGWGCRVGCEGLVDPRLLVPVGVLWVEMGPLLGPGTIQVLSCHQWCSAQKCLAVGGFLL